MRTVFRVIVFFGPVECVMSFDAADSVLYISRSQRLPQVRKPAALHVSGKTGMTSVQVTEYLGRQP